MALGAGEIPMSSWWPKEMPLNCRLSLSSLGFDFLVLTFLSTKVWPCTAQAFCGKWRCLSLWVLVSMVYMVSNKLWQAESSCCGPNPATPIHLCMVWSCFSPVAVIVLWPARSKIFILWPCTEKVSWSLISRALSLSTLSALPLFQDTEEQLSLLHRNPGHIGSGSSVRCFRLET